MPCCRKTGFTAASRVEPVAAATTTSTSLPTNRSFLIAVSRLRARVHVYSTWPRHLFAFTIPGPYSCTPPVYWDGTRCVRTYPSGEGSWRRARACRQAGGLAKRALHCSFYLHSCSRVRRTHQPCVHIPGLGAAPRAPAGAGVLRKISHIPLGRSTVGQRHSGRTA